MYNRTTIIVLIVALSIFSMTGMTASQSQLDERYAYATFTEGDSEVQIVEVDPNLLTEVGRYNLPLPSSTRYVEIHQSPNGRWMAVVPIVHYPESDILLFNFESQETRLLQAQLYPLLTIESGVAFGAIPNIAWSPNGEFLAFISNRTALNVYELHSNSLTTIASGGTYGDIGWSSDSESLIVARQQCSLSCETYVEVFETQTNIKRESIKVVDEGILGIEGLLCDLQLSPDERFASYVKLCGLGFPEAEKEVFLIDFENDSVQQLTHFSTYGEQPLATLPIRFAHYELLWLSPLKLLISSQYNDEANTTSLSQTLIYDVAAKNSTYLSDLLIREMVSSGLNSNIAMATVSFSSDVVHHDTKLAHFDGTEIIFDQQLPYGYGFRWHSDNQILAYLKRERNCDGCAPIISSIFFYDGEQVSEYSINDDNVVPIGWVSGD